MHKKERKFTEFFMGIQKCITTLRECVFRQYAKTNFQFFLFNFIKSGELFVCLHYTENIHCNNLNFQMFSDMTTLWM